MEPEVSEKKFELNWNSIYSLKEIRKWAYFLSILGFVMLGVMALLFPALSLGDRSGYGLIPALIMVVFMILIYFFPVYYLYKFSTLSKAALEQPDGQGMEEAFGYLARHYKYIGILMIVVLSVYLIAGAVMLITTS